MKPYLYSLIAVAAACGLASAQTTAYTTPVGYVSLGDDTIGQPAIKAATDVTISIPLVRPTEYAGVVATTTSNTITITGAAFTANQWTPIPPSPGNGTPYLVTINSGTVNGFVGLITLHDATKLTVTPVTGGNLTSVAVGDKVKIYKAWTLASLFPSGTFPAGVRVFAFSGVAPGINIPADLNNLWNGTNWTRGATIVNDMILYPGESFFVRTLATQVATLTVTGEVPTANSRAYIDKISPGVAQDTRVGYVSPVNEVLANSSLSASLTPGDRLFGFNNNTAGTNKPATVNILWNGTNWAIGATNVSDPGPNQYSLKAGAGYFVRRLAGAAVGTTDWNDQQSYNPLP